MRKYLLAILFVLPLFLHSTTYYISTTGNDANNGTSLATPWRTLQKISTISPQPGDIFYIRAGVYNSGISGNPDFLWIINNFNGTAANPILISAYPPDFPSGGRITFNCLDFLHAHDTYGIQVVNSSWLIIRGIKCTGVPQQPSSGGGDYAVGNWFFTGNNHDITIDNCEAENSQTGYRIYNSSNLTFNNCDAHYMQNPYSPSPYGGSDGWGRYDAGNTSQNTVFNYCRSWWCSDDGWDLIRTNGLATFNGCWSFWNGYLPGTFNIPPGGFADGSGYKYNLTNGDISSTLRIVSNSSLAFWNTGEGFDQSDGQFMAQHYNCTSFHNGKTGFKFGYYAPNIPFVFKNNITYQNASQEEGGSVSAGWVQATNSWNGFSFGTSAFASLDTSGVSGARLANGNLPILPFLHLANPGAFINTGTNVGLPFQGSAPDLGAFEYTTSATSPTLSASSGTILCNGGTTTVTLTASQGTPPYTYTSGTTTQSSNLFTVGAGNYNYIVTDAAGLTASTSISITQPTSITVNVSNGTSPATVTVTASGGTGTLNYQLGNGSYQSSNIFSNVVAGSYTVNVKDGNGCIQPKVFTVSNPAVTALGITASVTNATCNGVNGSATIGATNGTSPYSGTGIFSRAAGTYTFSISDASYVTNNLTFSNQQNLNNVNQTITSLLADGRYTAGLDQTKLPAGQNGRVAFQYFTGAYDQMIAFSLTNALPVGSWIGTGFYAGVFIAGDANVYYIHNNSASILLEAAVDGTWYSANRTGSVLTIEKSTNFTSWSNLVTLSETSAADLYPIMQMSGSAANRMSFPKIINYSQNQTHDTTITINQPSQITIGVAYGFAPATVATTAGGGSGSFTYSIDGGSYQAGSSFSSVSAGDHYITVKDGNNCTNVKTFTVLFAPITPLYITASSTNATCNGSNGSVTIGATGGDTPYTGTGTFSATPGTHTYTVGDANGQTHDTTITITQPTQITINTDFGYAPATITVTASGGVPAYQYKIDAGSYQAGNTFSSVASGSHTITVKDANNCTSATTVTVLVAPNPPLFISASVTNPTCNGTNGSVTIGGSGGTSPYSGTGVFSRAAGTFSFTVTDNTGQTHDTTVTLTQPTAININVSYGYAPATVTTTATGGVSSYQYKIDAGSYQSSAVFSNVSIGDHTITVKDGNNCTNTKTFTVTNAPVTTLYLSASVGTILCNGGAAAVIISGSGGTSPYVGTGTFSQFAGTTTYTISDNSGQTHDTTITITQPVPISVDVTYGYAPANLSVSASGGVSTYQYKLDNGSYQNSPLFSGVSFGTHTVIVKDGNDCTNSKTFSVTNTPIPLSISVSHDSILCKGGASTILVTAAGGVPPYTGTGEFSQFSGTGTYTVRDNNGNQHDTSIVIYEPAKLIIQAVLTGSPIPVFGGTTYAAIYASDGAGRYVYKIDNSSYDSSNSFNNLSAGNHVATVKDANGCTYSVSFSITQVSNIPSSGYFIKQKGKRTIYKNR